METVPFFVSTENFTLESELSKSLSNFPYFELVMYLHHEFRGLKIFMSPFFVYTDEFFVIGDANCSVMFPLVLSM